MKRQRCSTITQPKLVVPPVNPARLAPSNLKSQKTQSTFSQLQGLFDDPLDDYDDADDDVLVDIEANTPQHLPKESGGGGGGIGGALSRANVQAQPIPQKQEYEYEPVCPVKKFWDVVFALLRRIHWLYPFACFVEVRFSLSFMSLSPTCLLTTHTALPQRSTPSIDPYQAQRDNLAKT